MKLLQTDLRQETDSDSFNYIVISFRNKNGRKQSL